MKLKLEELKDLSNRALRSGKYNHGTNQLKREAKDGQICHCALGAIAEEAGIPFDNPDDSVYSFNFGEGHDEWWRSFVPNVFVPTCVAEAITRLNDKGGGFEAAADYIDQLTEETYK